MYFKVLSSVISSKVQNNLLHNVSSKYEQILSKIAQAVINTSHNITKYE